MEASDTGGARALAFCGLAMSMQAREVLVELLPSAQGTAVADWMRRSEELSGSASGPVEEALRLRLPVGAEEDAAEDQAAEDEVAGDVDADDVEDDEQVTCWPEVAITCLLASTPAPAAARLLGELPLGMQGEVTALLATSTPMSVARRLTRPERTLLQEVRGDFAESETWGVRPACLLLRALRGTRRLRRALTSTAEVDVEAAAIVQSHLFDFDDLTRLRPQELQRLLGRIDNPTLARALVDAGERVSADVFTNASGRRALLLQDELALQTEVTAEEVEMARGEVMAEVRKLYERGDITTYFGSIYRAGHSDDDGEDEEDDGEDDEDGVEAGEGQQRSSGSRRGRGVPLWVLLLAAGGGLLILTVGLLLPGPRRDTSTADRQQRATLTPSDAQQSRIAVASGDTSDGEAQRLSPGESLRNTREVDAILQSPQVGSAEVAVAPGTQVEAAEANTDVDLRLRVGRVTVAVGAVPFTVGTPVGTATGEPGSVFSVRVVLDATTTIRARNGNTQVHSREARLLARLAAGEWARVNGVGGVELSR